MIPQYLIGFDLRTWPPPVWDQRRRQQFLYKPDVLQVLSVDAMAWPAPEGHEQWREQHIGFGFVGLHEAASALYPIRTERDVLIALSIVFY